MMTKETATDIAKIQHRLRVLNAKLEVYKLEISDDTFPGLPDKAIISASMNFKRELDEFIKAIKSKTKD